MLSDGQYARLQAGVEHQLSERFDLAATIYEQLLAESPGDFQVNHLLGALRHQQGRAAEAVPLLLKARAAMPLSAATHMCLGLALGAVGRRTEAERSLRTSIGLDAKSPENWANLGALYATMGRSDDAIVAFKQALLLKPDYAHGWTGLGAVLHLNGRTLEAIECHNRALELDPENRKARFGRAQALQARHRVDEALADFDAQLALCPEHHEARSFRLFMLNYRENLSRERLFEEHLAYGRAVRPAHPPRPFANAPEPGRRLKVAFLSPDFRTHSVAFFIEPLLAHLDPGCFEIFLYHDHYSSDGVSERLKAHASVWRNFAGLAHDVVEEAIRADGPDLLVDLAGHTGFNRMELLARRVAPVQLSYLGYPNTTGLEAMDFRLTDARADPLEEADPFYTERLLRFAPCAWTYQPWPECPEPGPIPDGPGMTFGSFNALSKVNDSTLELWIEVLAAVPGSRLLLKSSGIDLERWRERLLQAGLPADRFELLPMAATIPEHLAAYAQIDVALDPFPYNGTTTTCEALWMGVPVVSLAGDRHSARVGASLLAAVGRPEWIASSRADYVRIAAALAADPGLRRAWRAGARGQLRASPLFDYSGQAARFGSALREAWGEWCAAQRPAWAAAS